MVRYTLEQRVFLYDIYMYVKYGSARKCRRKFRPAFRDERVPSRQTIHNLVNKLRTMGFNRQETKTYAPLAYWEDDIGARLEHTPRKSRQRLAQETGVLKSIARRATQLLKLRPYKTTVIQPCSRAIQLAGFIFSAGFYSLSSKVRSICNYILFRWCVVSLPGIHKYAK
jgi:hypothetical protein